MAGMIAACWVAGNTIDSDPFVELQAVTLSVAMMARMNVLICLVCMGSPMDESGAGSPDVDLPPMGVLFPLQQGNGKRASFAGGAVHIECAAMLLDDLPCDRKPDP